jgi:hypothetical protein
VKFTFKVTTAVLLLSLLILTAAIGFTRRQIGEDPFAQLGISRCDDGFCVAGIRPDKMRWRDARLALLSLDYATEDDFGGIHLDDNKIYRTFVQNTYDVSTVVMFYPTNNASLFTVGELVEYYGVPCMVTVSDDVLFVDYPQFFAVMNTVVRNDPRTLSPDTPVYSLHLAKVRQACTQPKFTSVGFVTTRWCGFQSMSHYLANCPKIRAPE